MKAIAEEMAISNIDKAAAELLVALKDYGRRGGDLSIAAEWLLRQALLDPALDGHFVSAGLKYAGSRLHPRAHLPKRRSFAETVKHTQLEAGKISQLRTTDGLH
jgi:hypothetical protein